jgi:hypothetical protein
VLVIIGLLIGGILGAQSMIETAKVQSFIRQIQQYDVAVSNFETKYGSFPGDSVSFGCTNSGNAPGNVCGDGIIEDTYGNQGDGCCFVDSFSAEVANFWPQLQAGGFSITGVNFTSAITGSFSVSGANRNSPLMRLGNNTGVVIYNDTAVADGLDASSMYYYIADWSHLTSSSANLFPGTSNAVATIGVNDALAIDVKIDDGVPGTGVVHAAGVSGEWARNGTCVVGSVYNNASSDVCILLIKVLSSQGL